jgi:EF hand
MSKHLLAVVFLIACKTDAPEPAAASGGATEQTAKPGNGAARSAKIDLGPRRPNLPATGAEAPEAGSDDRRARWDERRKERMAKLDTDGDGVVSDEEREAARDVRQKGMLDRFDKDHDGKLSDEERAAMRQERTAAMRTRLDRNNDGVVTPDELQGSRFSRISGDADTNHDGNISTEELDAALKASGGRRGRNRGAAPDDTTE